MHARHPGAKTIVQEVRDGLLGDLVAARFAEGSSLGEPGTERYDGRNV
jgi:hypothetical protein